MKLRDLALRWETFLLLVLVVVLLLGAQASDHFLTASNISIALAGMMPVAIVALPMTLVIMTGEIDISVGSIIGLCASIMGVCLEHHLPVGLAMASGLAIGTLAGLFNGVMVVVFGLPSLVVTIGTLGALSRGRADHPQGEGRQQFSGLVSADRFRHDRRDADPVERSPFCRAFPRIRVLPSSDPRRPGDLRHWQQSRSRAIFRRLRRAHDPWRCSLRPGWYARSRRSC